ncbi:MAG: acyltransferase [Alphaproteobacteria bacterium]|nr:acyltransferase [Alphaproteobacteria bacterium]
MLGTNKPSSYKHNNVPKSETHLSSEAGSKQNRIKVLDGLRAFAILLVLVSHSTWCFNAPIVIKIGEAGLHNLLYNGWVGVDLFFVLSGFLITSQLLRKTLSIKTLKTYALRRFFRIAPAYYIVVFATLIVYYFIPDMSPSTNLSSDIYSFVKDWSLPLLAHFVFLHDYLGRVPYINGLFWSIPVEIKFYIILPCALFLLANIKNSKNQIIAIVGLYILYVLGKTITLYFLYDGDSVEYSNYFLAIRTPFHMSLDGLLIGVLCAFLLNNPYFKALKSHTLPMNVLFVGGLLLFAANAFTPHFVQSHVNFFEQSIMLPLFALSFGLMLVSLVRGCFASHFFENKILRYFALISYSLYLGHLFVIPLHGTLEDVLEPHFSSSVLCWLVVFIIFMICSVTLAYILHRTIERPFLEWSRKWFKYPEHYHQK